jgi:glycosyltransferase involved in cell wall biosynthesis
MKVALLTTDSREHFKDYSNPQPYFGTAPEALLEGFKLLPKDIEVHVISCLQRKPASSPAKLAGNIYYHSLHVPNIGWMKTLYQGCIRSVHHKLREIAPDIVHGQGTERDCSICAVYSGYPNVLTVHGNMRQIAAQLHAGPLSYYWLASRIEKWCLRRTDGVVAISNHTRGIVEPLTHRSWLIPNAVHPSFFGIERQVKRPPRILCVANVSPWKNQIGLIDALDSLAEKLSFEIRLAGGATNEGVYSRKFLQIVSERSWCRYLGPLHHEALREELSAATVLVLPSFEDNCPMVILEAAAAGLPVAASNVGGIPELVQDRETGRLFDPHSAQDMARVIGELLADEAQRRRFAARAKEVSQERFAPRRIASQHLQTYHEVLAETQKCHRPK